MRLFGLDSRAALVVLAGMTLVTPLPWYASYLMPDLYAGLLVLAAALLVFAWDRLTTPSGSAPALLYLGSITFHLSHLLLAAGLLAVAVSCPWPGRAGWTACGAWGCRSWWRWPCCSARASSGFGAATLTPNGAPFLLARSWEDGPARAYLERTCPAAGWAICPHLGRLAGTAQEFLWRPHDSYWAMDLPTRAAMRAEERRSCWRALLADPLGQVRGSLSQSGDAARPVRAG